MRVGLYQGEAGEVRVGEGSYQSEGWEAPESPLGREHEGEPEQVDHEENSDVDRVGERDGCVVDPLRRRCTHPHVLTPTHTHTHIT